MDFVKTASEILELPAETVFGVPKITIVGNIRVLVENYSALLDYKKNNIQLKSKSGVIDITGKNLEITGIGEENITVSGEINCVKVI